MAPGLASPRSAFGCLPCLSVGLLCLGIPSGGAESRLDESGDSSYTTAGASYSSSLQAGNSSSSIYRSPTYPTEYGPVVGWVLPNGVFAFHSIPYAQPPVGRNRWTDPSPPASWTEPKDVTALANICPQPKDPGVTRAVVGKEDCLYLYVYTSSGPNPAKSELKPVMLWVHGGGLQVGDGYLGDAGGPSGFYDGSNLVREFDVVVVSIQYRLGTLGFLASDLFKTAGTTPSGQAADGYGNFGFKDQRYAMQWVQRNIQGFGGDPNRVMLFGESAGGISMCYHLTSPASAGLFQAITMESGSCYMQIQNMSSGWEMAESIAGLAGCPVGPTVAANDTRDCLLNAPLRDLVYPMGDEKAALPGSNYWAAPDWPWCMTVDGTTEGLVSPPHVLLSEGSFSRVPTIFGTNTNEFNCDCDVTDPDKDCLFADGLPSMIPGLSPPYSDADVATVLGHFLGKSLSQAQFDEALAMYPIEEFKWNNTARISAMLVDTTGWIGSCSTQKSAQMMLGHGHADIWLYHFARLGEMRRVGHFSEVGYVFQNCLACGTDSITDCCQGTNNSAPDLALSKLMGSYWSTHAAKGDPNRVGLPFWPRYKHFSKLVMRFDIESTVTLGYRELHCAFWDKIYGGESGSHT
eukprot:jgi/Bigna1/126087/aug1.2_g795